MNTDTHRCTPPTHSKGFSAIIIPSDICIFWFLRANKKLILKPGFHISFVDLCGSLRVAQFWATIRERPNENTTERPVNTVSDPEKLGR